MSWKLRSTAAAFVLVLVTGTAAEALPLSGPLQVRAGESFLEVAWGWITSWLPDELRSAQYDKEGGMMDPNGFPVGGDPASTECRTDEGGMMDPNGFR